MLPLSNIELNPINTRFFIVFNINKNKLTHLKLNQFNNLILNQIVKKTNELRSPIQPLIKIKNYIIFEDSKKWKTKKLFFLHFELSHSYLSLSECLECVLNKDSSLFKKDNIQYIRSEIDKSSESDLVNSCFKNYLPFLSKYKISIKNFDIVYDSYKTDIYYNQFFPKPKRIKKNKIVFMKNVLDSYRLEPLPKLPNYPPYSFLSKIRYPQLFYPYLPNYKLKKI